MSGWQDLPAHSIHPTKIRFSADNGKRLIKKLWAMYCFPFTIFVTLPPDSRKGVREYFNLYY